MKLSLHLTLGISLTCGFNLFACQPHSPTANYQQPKVSAEQEYASFNTQALTQTYLQRKIETWVQRNDEEAMRREIEFARIKHPQLLIDIMHAYPALYTAAEGMAAVSSFRSISGDFNAYMMLLAPPSPLPAGMNFVNIPAGSFQMGQSGIGGYTEPVHTVTLDTFQMMTTEVTQKQWWDIMGSWPKGAGTTFPGDGTEVYGVGDHYPMYYVSWCDIVGASWDAATCSHIPAGQSFLDKLNATGTGTYRLPTEAEWEYAARAGTTTRYTCGHGVGFSEANANACPWNMAWLLENNTHNGAVSGTKPVATKQSNAWGLYDMHGNVVEWVQDRMGIYSSEAQTNPTGPSTGDQLARGGGWNNFSTEAYSAYRNNYLPTYSVPNFGFRVVRLP